MKEAAVFSIHAEGQIRIAGFQEVIAGSELSQDGVLIGRAGGEIVRGLVEGIHLGHMAGSASVVTNVVVSRRMRCLGEGEMRGGEEQED